MEYLTVSDKNYLLKGLTLFESLRQHDPNATLNYLCLDGDSYKILSEIPGIKPISFLDIKAKYPQQFQKAQTNPKSKYGDQYSQFCWTMTPFGIWHLQKESNSDLIYMDSDLLFYHNPSIIDHACLGKSIGIHTHRFSSFDIRKQNVGKYNVGAVLIRNTETGRKVSRQWLDWMLDPENEYAELYGQCGDQAYLTLWPELYKEEVVEFDTHLSHGAPWCFSPMDFLDDHMVRYKGEVQPLVFNHFSHFNADFKNNSWSSSNHGEWRPDKNPDVARYYQDYFDRMKKVKEKYSL